MAEAIVYSLSAHSTDAPTSVIPIELLSDDAAEFIGSSENARGLIEQLLSERHGVDALTCITRLLPRYYVLAWGISTLRQCVAEESHEISDADRAGIALANRWLSDSSEDSRVAAREFAENDEYATPGGWIAAAAAWMSGSLGPPDCDPVDPPATLPGEAVAAALIGLAARDPERLDESLALWVGEALKAFGGDEEGEKS